MDAKSSVIEKGAAIVTASKKSRLCSTAMHLLNRHKN
jgi:Holliday junction resolvase-like predicted endonuclease